MTTSRLTATFAIVSALLLSSCGGGGGGGTPPPGNSTLRITQSVIPDGMEGQLYSVQFSSSGGNGTVTWSILDSNASWLTMEAGTGKAGGTPEFAGNYYVNVQARSGTQAASATVFIWISDLLSITQIPTDAIRGYPYFWQTFVSGGKPPFTMSVNGGALPAGVTATLNGQYLELRGTPENLGDYTATLQFKDSATTQQILNQELTIKVLSVLKITSQSLNNGVVGRAYSDTLKYVNGTPPLQWNVTENSGFSVNATGAVSGTPKYPMDMLFVRVTDSSTPQQTDQRYVNLKVFDTLHVNVPVTAFSSHVNEPFRLELYPQGGVPPVTTSLASGSLPPGISLVDGVLIGTPTTAGTWNAGVHYSDAAVPPQTYDQPVVITILPPVPVILNLPSTPVVGEAYSYQLMASKGTAPYKWDIVSGALPAGLSLSQGGLLSGTVLLGGEYNFSIRVTDSATPAQSASRSAFFRIPLQARGRNDSVTTATTANPYGTQASLSPYENPAGTAAPDSDYYKLYAQAGSTVSVNVYPQKTSSTPWDYASPTDTVLEIVDANGARHSTCRDTADDVPLGPLVVDPTPAAYDDECLNDDVELGVQLNSGLRFKVPGQSGQVTTFYAHVLDYEGNARPDMLYTLQADGALQPVTIIGEESFVAVKGIPLVINFQAIGGSNAYSWTIASGTVPPGLAFNANATVTGTPTTAGTWVFAVKAADTSSPPIVATKTVAIRVAEPLQFTTSSLPAAQTGVPYNFQLAWTGGTAPFQFHSGTLPPGIQVGSNGVLSGTPTVSDSYFVSVSIVDSANRSDTNSWTLNVTNGPLYVATTALPNATKNSIYSAFVKGAGGKQPYSWQLTSGALPAGMALNASTGEVRGIPTSTGVFSFTLKVTDANAANATATLQLTVQ